MDLENIACKTCNKTFKNTSLLFCHFRKVHNDYNMPYYRRKTWPFKCLEGCDVSYKDRQGLENHLVDVHKFVFKKRQQFFLSIKDFRRWLKTLEKLNLFYTIYRQKDFLLMRKHKVSTCYHCTPPINDKKRGPKPKKKRTIGCTSYMEVEELWDEVYVTILEFHYGHDNMKVRKLPFPKFSERLDIPEQGNSSTSDSTQSSKEQDKESDKISISKTPLTIDKTEQSVKRSANSVENSAAKQPRLTNSLTNDKDVEVLARWPTADDFGRFVTAELRKIDEPIRNKVKISINSALRRHNNFI